MLPEFAWRSVLGIQLYDKLKNEQSVVFVLCTTREINAAAGLRPQKPIVGFRQSQSISLCLYLPFSASLSLYLRVSSPETAEPPPFNLLQPCTSEVLPTPF